MSHELRIASRLTGAIAMLAALQAGSALWFPSLYRDNALVRAAWHGNDWITLVLAVPILIVSWRLARRGSRRAELVWLGMLDYTLYNYAFYLFGAAFNLHFLLYAALFAASLYALPCGLLQLGHRGLPAIRARPRLARAVAGYLFATALLLFTLWCGLSLGYVFSGRVPAPIVETGHPTGIVFALDLTLLVPPLLLAAIWLWRSNPWGTALGIMLSAKGFVYTLGLGLSTLFAVEAGFDNAAAQLPLWLALSIGSLVCLIALLRGVPGRTRALRSFRVQAARVRAPNLVLVRPSHPDPRPPAQRVRRRADSRMRSRRSGKLSPL